MKCLKCGSENSDKAKFCYECATPLLTTVETVIEVTINNDIQLEELKSALKDKYEIIREIGRGGMGIVYECRERSLDRTVALKVLPRELSYDKQFVERFKKEIKILAKIEHPNIVQLLSADEVNGFIYFTMKFVKGRNLAELIRLKGKLDEIETRSIAQQIAQALSFAHGTNILHRDLKPENVMIDDQGHVYIMDFGIARVLDGTRLTMTGAAIGTPEYMSPEQCSGESVPDGRSDIYSLGILMYEMLTGSVPFKGGATAVMYQHVNTEPASIVKVNENVSSDIINFINSCLDKKPEKRPRNAKDICLRLNENLNNLSAVSYLNTFEILDLKPNGNRAKIAIVFIFTVLLTSIVSLISNISQYIFLKSVINGETITSSTVEIANAIDARQQMIGIIFVIVWLISAVTFIMWFKRAYYNLNLKVNNLKYSSGWPVAGWFIPILNFFRPYKIMKELFEKTDYLLKDIKTYKSKIESKITFVRLWWFLWVICNLIGYTLTRISLDAKTIDQLITSTNVSIIYCLMVWPLAITTIKVIKLYSEMEIFLPSITKQN